MSTIYFLKVSYQKHMSEGKKTIGDPVEGVVFGPPSHTGLRY